MKKWKKVKKSWLAAGITAIVVIGAGIAALINASNLHHMFEPKDFERFENRFDSGGEYDSAAGDGEKSDLADESEDGENSADEEAQKALKVAEDETDHSDGLGLSNHDNNTGADGGNQNPDAFGISDNRGPGGVDVTPGSGGQNGGSGGSGNVGNGNGEEPGGGNGGGPGKPGKPDDPQIPDHPDTPDGPSGWEEDQLKPRDPVKTKDGVLVGLKAVIHREYCQGDVFQGEDATVTAVFRQEDGKNKEVIVPYGGKNGYSVKLSTKLPGKCTASFTYLGVTARAEYEVISSGLSIHYYGVSGGRVYSFDFPGPLGADQETLDELSDMVYHPTSGGIVDLTDIHSRLIAYLGDKDVESNFLADAKHKYVTFLEEEGEYLKTMLSGFQYYSNGSLAPGGPYLYYPVYNWGAGNLRHVMDIVSDVPKGYRIRRIVQNKGEFGQYKGSQVLEQYTGEEEAVSVPMGVTEIALKGKQGNGNVTKLVLPESVCKIDFAGVAECLPGLEAYEVSGRSLYQVIDGVLYSRDKKTMLSVPPGMTDIKIPDTVKVIADGAFRNSSVKELNIPASVVTLEAGCFEEFHGDVIRVEGNGTLKTAADTGYSGKILFSDSSYDVVMKKGMFVFKSRDILFGAMDQNGVEIPGKTGIYQYDGSRNILTLKDNDEALTGIPADTRGYYVVPDGITAVEEGAFSGAAGLQEISLPETVRELKKGSLIFQDNVREVFLSADMTEISPMVFGDPAAGGRAPDIAVCVPKEFYTSYVEKWSEILDPVYGKGTAERLLQVKDDAVFYENDAKYQKTEKDGTEYYKLLEVYAKDRTAFRVKAGTTEIKAGAFSGCERLEILYLPNSLKKAGKGTFAGCKNLQTVTVKKAELLPSGAFDPAADHVTIYEKGSRFSGFAYYKGIIYGKSSDGIYTVIDVPTDYAEKVVLYQNTGCLNAEAFKDCEFLTSIEIPDQEALTEIGERCFENCTAIESIDLSKAGRLKKVGNGAFRSCTNLIELYLPDHLEETGKGICYDCTSLRTVKAEGITKVKEEMFFNCQSLLSDGISLGWDKITVIGDRAFAYCSLISSVPATPRLNSLGVRAFYTCQRLRSMTLPGTLSSMGEECFGECSSMTQIVMNGSLTGISRYCFYGCRELVKVEFGAQQKKVLEVVGVQAFGQCSSLESLDLSGCSALKYMGERTFAGCGLLAIVRLPGKLSKVPDYCFEGCSYLSTLTLLADDAPVLGEAVFGDSLSLFIHVWVKEEKLAAYRKAYTKVLDPAYGEGTVKKILGKIDSSREYIRGIIYEFTSEGRVLKEVTDVFEGSYTVPIDTVRIEAEAFMGCNKLTGIELPAGSKMILGDRCFKDCRSLESAELNGDIPAWGSETFMNCTSLKNVDMGKGYHEVIREVGRRAFKGCTGLAGRDALSIRAAVSVLGEECFAGCTNLEAIPLTEYAYTNLEVIGSRAFEGCESLTQFLTSAFTGVKTLGAYAFSGCDSLRGPSVPANVTSIGEGCFSECANLTTVSFYCVLEEYPKDCFKNCPMLSRTGGVSGALSGLKKIGPGAYEGCSSLTTNASWNLGRYSGLEEIGENAFKGCTNMSSIELSAAVKKIGAGAFDGLSSVGQMILHSENPPEMGRISLEAFPEGFCIRVPDSQASGDRVYKAYLSVFTEMFGGAKAYEILDSISDGAKSRNQSYASEEKFVSDEASKESDSAEKNLPEEERPQEAEKMQEEESGQEKGSPQGTNKRQETENVQDEEKEIERPQEIENAQGIKKPQETETNGIKAVEDEEESEEITE